jgi:malate dehydrogenase (oxaloacetate-decarboxylating)
METSNTPSPSYSLTLRIEYPNRVKTLGTVTSAIGEQGGDIGAIDIVKIAQGSITRDITFSAADYEHGKKIIETIRSLPSVDIVNVSDRTFLLHLGGTIEIQPKVPVKTRDDISMAYTPGVARISQSIAEDPMDAFNLTIKKNTVAVVTDGSAVLGLGAAGPLAALPVMEGKALFFKEFGGVDAFPICLDAPDIDELVNAVKAIAPTFGGIHLEDIAAPRCFEVEARLTELLDIPVMHNDQWGTAIVVLAALINALRITQHHPATLKVVINSKSDGPAGIATARLLTAYGVRDVILCDEHGALYAGREVANRAPANGAPLDAVTDATARLTNPRGLRGSVQEALQRADVLIGFGGPVALTPDDIATMSKDPIVFAMAHPYPEIDPASIEGIARIIATGKSDYPNQINNMLCFPGFFRGLLDARASRVTETMKLAAARAIADIIGRDELMEDHLIPSVFDRRVTRAVSAAVMQAARDAGVARRTSRTSLM